MRAIIFIACFILYSLGIGAQKFVPFNGLLLDASGKAIKRTRVYVLSSGKYAITNKKGQFGLTDIKYDDTLKIVRKKKEYIVPVLGRKSLKIHLFDVDHIMAEEDSVLINWGYGYVSRREYTGVSNIISGEELRNSGFNDIISALQGRIPGLSIITNGRYDEATGITIRGNRSFSASSTPLFVLDNVVISSLEGINLFDVDYIEILKDASAYGSGGANGAIIIHTRSSK